MGRHTVHQTNDRENPVLSHLRAVRALLAEAGSAGRSRGLLSADLIIAGSDNC